MPWPKVLRIEILDKLRLDQLDDYVLFPIIGHCICQSLSIAFGMVFSYRAPLVGRSFFACFAWSPDDNPPIEGQVGEVGVIGLAINSRS
jgi:hypothetical protein